MSKLALFNVYITERLTAAAVEIAGVVERTVTEYQEEISRSKEENERLRRLLDFKPHRTDPQQLTLPVSEEEVPPERQHCEQKWSPSLEKDPEPTQIKDEQEEIRTNQEEEQLEGLESDTKDSIFTVCEESDCDPMDFSSQISESREGDVLCVRIPQEIKTEPDGELYTVSEATSASHSLSEGYPGCLAAHSENSGSGNEVESEGLPSGSKALKSPRKQAKKRLSSHTSAGSGVTTNAAPPYCCKLCGSTFVYIGPLVNHVKNVHTKLTAEYRCGVCEEVFESIASLTEHLQTHIKATRTCNVCGKCFPSDSSMRTHMVTHTGEKQYQCKECGKCFKNKGYMHLHMRRHTGETPFWCKDCGESFTCKGYLKTHMKFHTSEEPQPTLIKDKQQELGIRREEEQLEGLESDTKDSIVTVCEESDCDPMDFSSQISESREGDVLCVRIPQEIKTEPDGELYTVSEATSASHSLSEGYPGCSAAHSENSGSGNEVESEGLPSGSKALKSPRKWASTHNRARGKVTTNASPYCCKLCGSTFVYIGPLVNHVKNVHTKHTKMCGVCEEVFESIASLTEHLQSHIKATRTCNVCGKCFPSDANLRTHMVSHTGEKQYQCKECGKSFKTKAYMKLHMRLHTGEKPFQCKECGESFTCNGYLRAHMKFHTGEKSYRCKDCGQDFDQKEQLETHMWTHQGQKPHGCKQCPKSFKRKEELTRHTAVHTGERPFKCTVCGHCFATPGNLTQHLTTHSGEKPYHCKLCSRCFRNNPLLKSHLRNRHKCYDSAILSEDDLSSSV
ncbi:zinc finger protein 2-like [Oncorhynchus kisutch]|uniref:Zinc finger protein 2-like n=1 Tax=Oncorhynchus kisutch TaxID=8019 RepID=A0A8C7DZD2_ONCKI|nr:zinc finger protein 2-like [Oncorhynchus kisutch]